MSGAETLNDARTRLTDQAMNDILVSFVRCRNPGYTSPDVAWRVIDAIRWRLNQLEEDLRATGWNPTQRPGFPAEPEEGAGFVRVTVPRNWADRLQKDSPHLTLDQAVAGLIEFWVVMRSAQRRTLGVGKQEEANP